jgi:membrane-bound lytic murein transglycosylase MltF
MGLAPVPVVEVAPHLEDYDLLDLLDAGVISATVVDSHKLELWRKVFEGIVVHDNLTLNEGGEIAWAVRKGSPELLSVVNGFMSQVRQGTLLGNILSKRYFGSADWITEIRRGDTLRERREIIQHIKTFSEVYRFDWRLIFAQAYQESKLAQEAVSSAGAIGVMQILPSTASDPNVSIPEIGRLENNIHAGTKYLSFIRNRYFDDPEIPDQDKTLLSLAAYNAGPRKISEARQQAKKMGLDPNIWFANVEIAAARMIGREPIVYVRNIYKNFVSFGLLSEKAEATSLLPDADIEREAKPGSRISFQVLADVLLALMFLGAGVIVWRRLSRRW